MRRLTAAIVVNDRMVRAPAKGAAGQWQTRTPEELRTLTSLAQAAVGFDAARGDVVSVQDLSFEENRLQTVPSAPAQMLSKAESSPRPLVGKRRGNNPASNASMMAGWM